MGTEGAQTNNNNVIKESVSTPSENINNTYASTTTQKNVDSNLKTVTTNLNTSSNTGNGNTTTITPTAETSQIKTVKTQNTANNLEHVSTQSTAKPENVFNNSQQAAGEITPTFTIDQISNAATALKSYVELNNKLPANVTINGTTMNMAQFLELLMTATLQINTGNKNPIPLRTYNNPTNPLDDIKSGNILTAEYLKIANDLKTYMDSTGKTPDYQYQTSLGTHLGFQNLIYMYSKILNFYNSAKYLPNFAEMKPWSSIASQSAGI
ncbi:MAG: hypothetical protein ACXVHY_11520, partial [Methanobacterium sp.]